MLLLIIVVVPYFITIVHNYGKGICVGSQAVAYCSQQLRTCIRSSVVVLIPFLMHSMSACRPLHSANEWETQTGLDG